MGEDERILKIHQHILQPNNKTIICVQRIDINMHELFKLYWRPAVHIFGQALSLSSVIHRYKTFKQDIDILVLFM